MAIRNLAPAQGLVNMLHSSVPAIVTALTVLAVLTVAALAAPKANAPDIKLGETHSCYLDDLDENLRCGAIQVPENPNKPEGRKIAIHYAILPAIKNGHEKQALLAIAGGPGQSAIEHAAGFNRMLTKVRQNRDILLIDQRGTGQSNPLNCENIGDIFAFDDEQVDFSAETKDCLDKITADGTDVTQYGSVNALNDFEAVRRHLGYDKLHLYGISYGSRMAQLYMRHFPEPLLTVTLDGVVPMQQSVLAIGDAIERAQSLLLTECDATLSCQQAFPNLTDDFARLDAKLAQGAIIEQSRDPLTNEVISFRLTRSKYLNSLRMAMYTPSLRALLPHTIHQGAIGNYQPLLGLYGLTADSTGIALGMHSSVVCGEDLHRVTETMRQSAKDSYSSRTMLEGLEAGCSVWQMPTEPEDFSQAIDSDIPTLLLSGELDPATPPSWGTLAQEKLSNSQHFVAPYATHGVAYQSCANDLIAKLVSTGSVKEINGECLNKDVRRSFYLNANTVEPVTQVSSATDTSKDEE
ncbi:peptidase S33, prolyl aminopeptidase [Shewanella denitrificans OS217]|jgi:pimeloyl-ACP methyl ester carboxylesterase|uniref:Peptidase S33, prolyl aminopeptidase n=1 Tax=Shewanella denitrificans (strain OS217 / ATCC BAA-1090 / DSM 15013) TaxID=318161 RepID=Q12T61_SHEDO|nr:alpha/beta fold hydrolase [Shewanella denitrificans]ABE53365.1 peptidase S33, prolyl aminopeptidase [Shewanella denitrificans OS217]